MQQQQQQAAPQIEGINIELSMQSVGVILAHLDRGVHADVRPVIDQIFAVIQRTQQAAMEERNRPRAAVVPINPPANDVKEPA